MKRVAQRKFSGYDWNLFGTFVSSPKLEQLEKAPLFYYKYTADNLTIIEETETDRIVSISSRLNIVIDFEEIGNLEMTDGFYLYDLVHKELLGKFEPKDEKVFTPYSFKYFSPFPPPKEFNCQVVWAFSHDRSECFRFGGLYGLDSAFYIASVIKKSLETPESPTIAGVKLVEKYISEKYKLVKFDNLDALRKELPFTDKKVKEMPKELISRLENSFYEVNSKSKLVSERPVVPLTSLSNGKNLANEAIVDNDSKRAFVNAMWISRGFLWVLFQNNKEKSTVSNYLINELKIPKTKIKWERI